MQTVYLALGSNLGDRETKLSEARKFLDNCPEIEIEKISSLYETEPWPKHEVEGGREVEKEKQNWHLNQVIQIVTTLTPENLLSAVQEIEKKIGKQSKPVWGSREIDIDILLYGEEILELPNLTLPHKFMADRQFVLIPLLEIAPELIDPRTEEKFSVILKRIKNDHSVSLYNSQLSNTSSSQSNLRVEDQRPMNHTMI